MSGPGEMSAWGYMDAADAALIAKFRAILASPNPRSREDFPPDTSASTEEFNRLLALAETGARFLELEKMFAGRVVGGKAKRSDRA